jgi:hypothetical protein
MSGEDWQATVDSAPAAVRYPEDSPLRTLEARLRHAEVRQQA